MENTTPARRGRPQGPGTAEGELTGRQAAIVRYITETVDRQGYPPSMREIGKAVDLNSTSSVAYQLLALERKASSIATRTGLAPTGSGRHGRLTSMAKPWNRSMCRSSAGSPPARPCSPTRWSRTSTPCPVRSWATARCSR